MRVFSAAVVVAAAGVAIAGACPAADRQLRVREYGVPARTRPHDVAPARDGGVSYTAQGSAELGWLNPKTGRSRLVGSARVPRRTA